MIRLFIGACLLLSSVQVFSADFMITQNCKEDFPETMSLVQSEITEAGYTVSRVQRVDRGLAAAGYTTDKYRLVFFAQQQDIEWVRENSYELMAMLPLKITIYQGEGLSHIAALDPAVFTALYPGDEPTQLITRWSQDVRNLLKAISASCEG